MFYGKSKEMTSSFRSLEIYGKICINSFSHDIHINIDIIIQHIVYMKFTCTFLYIIIGKYILKICFMHSFWCTTTPKFTDIFVSEDDEFCHFMWQQTGHMGTYFICTLFQTCFIQGIIAISSLGIDYYSNWKRHRQFISFIFQEYANSTEYLKYKRHCTK